MSLLLLFQLVFLIAPLSIFIHELGHVLTARLCQAKHIRLVLGSGPSIIDSRYFQIGLAYFIGGSSSYEIETKKYSNFKLVLISIGGPLFNVIGVWIGSLLGLVHVEDGLTATSLFMLFNMYMAFMNFLPLKIGGMRSDGWLFFKYVSRIMREQKF